MTTLEQVDISKTKVAPVYKLARTGRKSSINARRVAEKVIEQVKKGQGLVSIGKAMREVGYSNSVAEKPNKVTEQQEYKDAMASWEQKLVKLRDKTINALHNKDLDKEKLYDVTGLLKVVDHSTALAQGKSTENVATKSEIVVFGSEDFLTRQLNNGSVKP